MADRQPDIVIIMADQMTAALTGAYGHSVVRTPALDSLCAEGVRFDAAYSNSPICAPARAAMLSGQFISRTRSYDNGAILPCDVPTYAHHLRALGYEVVASGKMHLVGADQLHGFERRLTTDIYPSTFKWTPNWRRDEEGGIPNEKGNLALRTGVCDWSGQLDYDTETQFRALEFVRARRKTGGRKRQRPFCLLVSYTHPHSPYQITRKYWDLYEGADIDTPQVSEQVEACRTQMDRWLLDYEGIAPEVIQDRQQMRTLRRAYYGMVSYVDELVSELLEALESCGLRDDAAVFFTSDHGDMLGERGFVEKRVFYEWSARVPLIASYPRRWGRGATCDEPVSLVDLFPTLVEFTGAQEAITTDGRSFLDLLEGRSDGGPERVAISEYHCEGVLAPCFMVRKGAFKYAYVHGHESQLFDLQSDPDEMRNLAGRAEFSQIESALRNEVLCRFDPDAIAADVRRSQAERILMQKAMNCGRRTTWDHQPFSDAGSMYVR
jgi:choline-sulfatase